MVVMSSEDGEGRELTRLMGSKCFESQQCDFEMNAGSNREPMKSG